MRIDLKYRPGETGRQDFQVDWHWYYQNNIIKEDDTTLDIGSGIGKIKDRVKNVVTSDIFPGCERYVDQPYLDIFRIPYKRRYSYLTMFDVIEHVKNDIGALECAMAVAVKGIFITTPNFDISKCHNEYHFREYTPEQFVILCSQISSNVRYYSGNSSGSIIEEYINSGDFCNHRREHQGALILC